MYFSGATSAPCLIFIFPAIFYIRIVPKEEEPLRSVPKILVSSVSLNHKSIFIDEYAEFEEPYFLKFIAT